MIRILIADDQSLIRQSLAAVVNLQPDFHVVAEASSGADAIRLADDTRPDVALLDVHMPDIDGISTAEEIIRSVPGCHVLMLTAFARPGYLSRAMKLGASGFILKDVPAAELFSAIRTVNRGVRVVDPTLASESLAKGASPLTMRETQVLAAVLAEASTTAIAGSLHLTEGTVRNVISEAMAKLHASRRSDAARIAAQNGWLDAL
ncbi:response regulator transcription factor [Microbacterium natoriense]|uniref:response regulator transcription factor n=1 Tax=Microbacterium natoriense TaxID=284570 RepID=UPI0027D85196|nr:response regulator transcription factor [Microbacterium natoriense]